MRQVLADVTPRTIILLPDGRVGFYAYRYVADDGRALGHVLVQTTPGAIEEVDVDALATVDVVWCDRQAQEALWQRLVAEGCETLTRLGGRYQIAPDTCVWLDAGPLALRIERHAVGVDVAAFGGNVSVAAFSDSVDVAVFNRDETAAGQPLRALHVLYEEV
jgi:hypothetical protein